MLLRDGTGLSAARVRAGAGSLLLCWLCLLAALPWLAPNMAVGRDFAAFWTAARLALHGQAVASYGAPGQAAMAALFGSGMYPAFFYPPPALLLWLPFAWLPFGVAAAMWIGVSGLGYGLAMRAMLGRGGLVLAAAFPGAILCALFGQNALFSTLLFAGFAMLLEQAPMRAGMLIGCLLYKPQLAVLVPLALIAARRWRALAGAALSAVALGGMSVVIFGQRSWRAFFAVLPAARAWNADGMPGFDRFASPYAAIRMLGGAPTMAWIVQGAGMALAAILLVWLVHRRPGGPAEAALLVTATGFCVPFLGVYDLVIFAIAGAWLAAEAGRGRWLGYERAGLAALYLAPLAIVAASARGIPLAPLFLILLAALVLRRVVGRVVRRVV
ncbi:MAG: DUF2029 domain-containing protein [Rhodospirillales bacterium]|nr:DUF2029 domain-containing protein [Rhodospirillales bacterium]